MRRPSEAARRVLVLANHIARAEHAETVQSVHVARAVVAFLSRDPNIARLMEIDQGGMLFFSSDLQTLLAESGDLSAARLLAHAVAVDADAAEVISKAIDDYARS
jgi:hypothetical protein